MMTTSGTPISQRMTPRMLTPFGLVWSLELRQHTQVPYEVFRT